MAKFASSGPTPETQPSLTDAYFKHTRNIVRANGDCEVTYAVFMRRPVTFEADWRLNGLRQWRRHAVPV